MRTVHATAVRLVLLSWIALTGVPAGAAPHVVRELIDVGAPSEPPSSGEVLAQRLQLVGFQPADAAELAQAGAVERDALLRASTLPAHALAKARLLLAARDAGEPVAWVGLSRAPSELDFVRDLATQFGDPDVAAWLVDTDPSRRTAAAVAAVEPEPIADVRTPVRRIEERLGERLDPMLPNLCRTCPQVDFVPPAPTTTYQTHPTAIQQPFQLEAGGCRIYRFVGQAGRQYRFSLCEGGGTSTFDSILQTWTGNCVAGPTNDDACAGGRSQVDVSTSSTQYIYVKVSSKTGVGGSYRLAYKDNGPAAPGGGGTTCPGCPSFEASFTPTTTWKTTGPRTIAPGGCRLFRFAVQLNRTYQFSTCNGGGSGDFDTVIETFGPSCIAGPSNDDSFDCAPFSLLSDLRVATQATAYLYVRVRGFSSSSGTFDLAFRDASNVCRACPNSDVALVAGTVRQSHSSSIAGFDECRTYRFALQGQNAYLFSLCPSSGGSASFDSVMTIRSEPSCSVVYQDDSSCGDDAQFLGYPGSTGTYHVEIASNGGVGPYTFTYQELCKGCPDFNGSPLVPLVPATVGDTLGPLECRTYRFDLTAGYQYVFSTCPGEGGSADFGAQLTLLDGSCGLVALDDASCLEGGTITHLATATGPHYLTVGGGPGTFSLAYRRVVKCTPCPGVDAGPFLPTMALQSLSGVLQAGDCITFSFTIVPGNYIWSLCPAEGGSAAFDSALTLSSAVSCPIFPGPFTPCGDDESMIISFGGGGTRLVTVSAISGAGPFTLRYARLS